MANCQVCNKEISLTLIDMGLMPIANALLKNAESKSDYHPLQVLLCSQCKLFQLSVRLDPKTIFNNYFYHSSYSSSWLDHARDFTIKTKGFIDFSKNNFILEVASNDGYLLKNFEQERFKVLGIEPANNVADIAIKAGIPTESIFFNEQTAIDLVNRHGKPKLIIANNVLAHVPDIKGFLRALEIICSDNSYISIEFPSVINLIKNVQFDTIYHEHFTYLSLNTLKQLILDINLKIFKVENLTTHGGSLRVWLTKKTNTVQIEDSVNIEMVKEIKSEIFNSSTLISFSKKAFNRKEKFDNFVKKVMNENKTIFAYGAAAKGISFLNFCGHSAKKISGVFDKNKMKQGSFIPGLSIEILNPNYIKEIKPDYIIILPWNLKEEIIKEFNFISNWNGKFVSFE